MSLVNEIKTLQHESLTIHDSLASKSIPFVVDLIALAARRENEVYDTISEGFKKVRDPILFL